MTKSRASLKGRGVDILLGGSAEPEETAAPVTGNQPAPATPTPDPFAGEAPAEAYVNPFAEPAPATSFAEGAGTAFDVNPFAEPSAQPGVESSGEPMTELAVESAFESEIVSSQPSAPVATSLPPEETPWLADETPNIPQAYEAGAETFTDSGPVSVGLPDDPTLLKKPMIGGLVMDFASTPPPEPFEPSTELTQTGLKVAGVSRTRQTVSEAEVLSRIGEERLKALDKRIDDLSIMVARAEISDTGDAGDALLYLRRARDKVLEDQRQFDEAEYLVNVAQYTINRALQIQRWSYSYGIMILFYGLAWFAIFSAGLILDKVILAWLRTISSVPETAVSMIDLFPAYQTVLAGGVGGILSLMYSLYKHIAKDRDFDRQFVMWYILQPFMGLIMGYIVHLFLVGIVFQSLNMAGEVFRLIGALVAIAAAFRPHYVYGWLDWVLKSIRPGGRAGEEEVGTGLAPTGDLRPALESAPVSAPPSSPAPTSTGTAAGVG